MVRRLCCSFAKTWLIVVWETLNSVASAESVAPSFLFRSIKAFRLALFAVILHLSSIKRLEQWHIMALGVLHLFSSRNCDLHRHVPSRPGSIPPRPPQLHGTPFRVSAVSVTILRAAGERAGT
jgi:hypothetical protein